jgi:hypothetical protein
MSHPESLRKQRRAARKAEKRLAERREREEPQVGDGQREAGRSMSPPGSIGIYQRPATGHHELPR